MSSPLAPSTLFPSNRVSVCVPGSHARNTHFRHWSSIWPGLNYPRGWYNPRELGIVVLHALLGRGLPRSRMGAHQGHVDVRVRNMDTVSKETRSRMMSSVRAKNTRLELEMRRRLFARGFRFRLHRKDLPGKPDIVLPKFSTVIFAHGCFWHQHGCDRSKLPETRRSWWKAKLEGNRRRDATAIRKLKDLGWRTMIVWECNFRRPRVVRADALDKFADRAARFLKSRKSHLEIPRATQRRNGPTGKRA